MQGQDSEWFQQALNDFALASGDIILVLVDKQYQIKDYNRGFEISLRPPGDIRGHSLSTLLSDRDGQPLDLEPGLSGGAPVPYFLRTWGGQELLLHAYPAPDDDLFLIGCALSDDASQSMQHMSRLTTEMGNLVRELRRANRRIEKLANEDVLTGLASRRYFLELLETALQHASRYHRPLCVLMLDLDHFKRINDRFGHVGGDAVLRAVGKLLLERARASDVAGRLGGEEFALFLPDTALMQAAQLGERLRQEIAALRPLGSDTSFTISIGIAGLQLEDQQAEALLMRSDRALYSAKEQGRNRVVIADQPS